MPDVTNTAAEITGGLNALGEPTLQSMGLGSFMPSGLIQQGLELLHAGLGLPWWGSIVVGRHNRIQPFFKSLMSYTAGALLS